MNQIQNVNSPRVFISYSEKDKRHAQRLHDDLQRDNREVIVDFIDFEPGKSIPEQIEEALN